MYPLSMNLVAAITARVTMGSKASENKEWIRLTNTYVLTAIAYAQELKSWPPFLRPLVDRFLASRGPVYQEINLAKGIIDDTIKMYDAQEEANSLVDEPVPIIYTMVRDKNSKSARNLLTQVAYQMNLAAGGIHTTAAILTQCLHDLAAYPQYIPVVRAEILEAYKTYHGNFTRESLGRMKKLDSFVKEVHRLWSPNLSKCINPLSRNLLMYLKANMQRRSTKSFTIAGIKFPAGTRLEVPTFAINRDEEYYKEAEAFQPFRFYDMSQANEDSARLNQYTAAHKGYLGWGLGKTTCPGRFLADIEIKLMLSEILLHYDIRNPEGLPRHPAAEYENQVSSINIFWGKGLMSTLLLTLFTPGIRPCHRSDHVEEYQN
jgi:cytochrome P450